MRHFLYTYRTGIKLVAVTLFLLYLLSFLMVEVSKLGYLKYLERQNYYKYARRSAFISNDTAWFLNAKAPKVQIASTAELKNWEDTKYIEYEANRTGAGEQGKPVVLLNQNLPSSDLEDYKRFGYNKTVSDHISVNRSVPDFRYDTCKWANNSVSLPSVSVIVVYREVCKSVLLRMLHSVLNRTPPELLKEIILVNDSTTVTELAKLDEYVAANLSGKVNLMYFPEKKGLIACRMEAAKKAKGEILIFIDPRTEVMINWLPPLINPIKDLSTIVTLPRLDKINKDNFKIDIMLPFRGLIDWHFDFIYTLKFEWQDEFTYYDVPIMHPDHAFAINREFFFEVGGYDEGMTLEGGENIDLSFKMWHCAGGIFEIPCSKIALMIDFVNPPIKDHVYRNYKRIAEIWMDNHKEFFYARDPERYAKIDAGDVSKQLKARSICSPFNYFLEFVADDLLKRYPLRIDHPKFASGTIKSLGNLNLCLDSFVKPLGLATCDKNSTNPRIGQNFIFSYNKNILLSHVDFCLDAVQMDISLCMYNGYSGQLWTYTLIDMQLKAYKDSAEYCLTANSANSLFMATCNNTNPFQKWEFGTVQIDALNNFNEINEYNLDLLDLSYEKTFENVIL